MENWVLKILPQMKRWQIILALLVVAALTFIIVTADSIKTGREAAGKNIKSSQSHNTAIMLNYEKKDYIAAFSALDQADNSIHAANLDISRFDKKYRHKIKNYKITLFNLRQIVIADIRSRPEIRENIKKFDNIINIVSMGNALGNRKQIASLIIQGANILMNVEEKFFGLYFINKKQFKEIFSFEIKKLLSAKEMLSTS